MARQTAREANGGEEALGKTIAQAKRQLERMIDLTPQVMLLVDRAGVVARCNRSLLELMGFGAFDEAVGKRLTEVFAAENGARLLALLEERAPRPLNLGVTTCRGETLELRFTVVNPGADDAVRVVTVDSVTAEKARAADLERSYKRDAVRALAGGLMHKVNQPLTVIMVKAALLHASIEKGTASADEIQATLKEIMDLTMEVSRMLKRLESVDDFVTEPYPGGSDILQLGE